MAVLKVRDDKGNVTEILTIKGDPGEKGEKGEKGDPGSGDLKIYEITYDENYHYYIDGVSAQTIIDEVSAGKNVVLNVESVLFNVWITASDSVVFRGFFESTGFALLTISNDGNTEDLTRCSVEIRLMDILEGVPSADDIANAYVSYAGAQSLSDTQKAQARNNIGAPSVSNPVMTGSFSMGRKDGTTVGDNSHAEGSNTTASGDFSHAEGYGTGASGDRSHAEGSNTTASGNYSHAEGDTTTASGERCHAEGFHTIASGAVAHAEGKYNIEDPLSRYQHIAGNGTSDKVRSNAYTLDWDGNGWFAGDVYVGSTSGTNRDDGSKKLATEEYVDSHASGSGGFAKKAELTVNIVSNAFRASAEYTPSSDSALVTCHVKDAYLTDETPTGMMCFAEYTGGEIRVAVVGVGAATHGAVTAIVEVFETVFADETTEVTEE